MYYMTQRKFAINIFKRGITLELIFVNLKKYKISISKEIVLFYIHKDLLRC